VWNHTFFWESMKPNGGGAPSGKLAEAINASFGSLDEFKTQFKNAGGCQGCCEVVGGRISKYAAKCCDFGVWHTSNVMDKQAGKLLPCNVVVGRQCCGDDQDTGALCVCVKSAPLYATTACASVRRASVCFLPHRARLLLLLLQVPPSLALVGRGW
jgi:hypothetical protein